MKKLLLINFFLLIILQGYSQVNDWEPLRAGWKYNFRLHTANLVTNTIFIDSTMTNVSNDSIHYINTIFKECDTCTSANGGPNPCNSCYAFYGRSQVFGKVVRELSSGVNDDYELDDDSTTYFFHPRASTGANWIFNSTYNISISVVNETLDSILGVTDSLKYFLLSTGDSIVLSKNHGFVKYPNGFGNNSYYRLTGIEGLGMGEHVPDFWDIYNFNVGDVFHYQGSYYQSSAPTVQDIGFDKQYTITAKYQSNDTLIYTVAGYLWGHDLGGVGLLNFSYNTDLIYVNTLNNFLNSYNQKFIPINQNSLYDSFGINDVPGIGLLPLMTGDTIYDYARFSVDSNGAFTKYFGEFNFLYTHFTIIDANVMLLNKISYIYNEEAVKFTYKTGLGQTDYQYSFFELQGWSHLIGYIKNGDTTGVINSVKDIENNQKLTIYPNPTSDFVNIIVTDSENGTIEVTDITGKVVLNDKMDSRNKRFNIKSLSPGLYVLSLKTKNYFKQQKLIITN